MSYGMVVSISSEVANHGTGHMFLDLSGQSVFL